MNLNLSEKLKTGLTPQEKIDCYRKAIIGLGCSDCGICYELSILFSGLGADEKEISYLFPELSKFRPKYKRRNTFWFNSTEERIQVLNKLIEEQNEILQNKG